MTAPDDFTNIGHRIINGMLDFAGDIQAAVDQLRDESEAAEDIP